MLWPEKRAKDAVLGDKVPGVIDRTTARSKITIPAGYVPDMLRPLQGFSTPLVASFFTSGGDIVIGPIPAGVPVGLLANIQPLAEEDRRRQSTPGGARAVARSADTIFVVCRRTRRMRSCAASNLIGTACRGEESRLHCKHGHYFGTGRQPRNRR